MILPTAVLIAGCIDAETASVDRFAAEARIIAFSGAAAGAASACFTCHGLEGQGNGAGAPRLAALESGYLERQLIAYADGRRDHPQMSWIARKLSPSDRRAVASYYESMPFADIVPSARSARSQLYHEGDPSRGLLACAACHGDRGQGIGPANPPLGGQPAAYLAEQLDLWRKAKRRNDPGGVMLRISQLLTPAEGRALAAYAAGLPGHRPSPGSQVTSLAAHRGDPRNDASRPPQHVPESARAAP